MVYLPSPRVFPAPFAPVSYPGHFETRRVISNGGIKWRNTGCPSARCWTHEDVGLEELEDGIWAVIRARCALARSTNGAGGYSRGGIRALTTPANC